MRKVCDLKVSNLNKFIANSRKTLFVEKRFNFISQPLRLFSSNSEPSHFCEKKELKEVYEHHFEKEIAFRDSAEKFKCFRVLDTKGHVLNSKYENIPKEVARKILVTMLQIKECDTRFNMAQREGKISFYMTCHGEEATTIASTAALSDEDMIYPQYREAACLLYRGFTIQDMANQLAGNEFDNGKARQMPVHYGSRKLNYQTVSSPLCTQVPQASGAGYHFRVQNMNKIAVTFFGDGAASEGDFHAALNFASVLNAQTLFMCRNNVFAISTPINDQYVGDGIAVRGLAYKINTIRVDGNDVFAVYNAVKAAREMMIKTGSPALIEYMSYRVGDHSTSDFSKMYRDNEEMEKWTKYVESIGDPITRLYNYLLNKNWITENEYNDIVSNAKEQVRTTLKNALKAKKPSIDSMFEDVYEHMPPNILEQREQLRQHIQKYPEAYKVEDYKRDH